MSSTRGGLHGEEERRRQRKINIAAGAEDSLMSVKRRRQLTTGHGGKLYPLSSFVPLALTAAQDPPKNAQDAFTRS